MSGWYLELGEGVLHLFDLDVAALGDRHGSRDHFGRVAEDMVHLLCRLDEELVAVELKAIRVVDGRRRLHRQQNLVRMRIVFAEIMRIVRRNQRDAELAL